LKSYEYFLYFISIYQALILDKILSIHVLVMLVASPSAKLRRTYMCRFDTLDALSTFVSSHTRLLIMCIFFLCVHATACLTVIF